MSSDQRLRAVLGAVLNVDPDEIRDDSSPDTIRTWDSVMHLNVVLALEAEFGVQFETEDIGTLLTVRAIRERLKALSAPQ